jgi:aminopeptidase N
MICFIGKVIDGLLGNITDSKSCFLTIKTLKKPAMGTWQCRIVHSASTFFQEVKIAATSNGKSSQMRLSKSVVPQKYVIFITPFIEKDNFTIKGHVEIDILFKKKNVRSITLHSQDLKIVDNTVKVTGSNKENFEITGFGFEEATHFLTIYLSRELPTDSTIKLSIDYLGELKEDLMGFYRSSYFNEETNSTEYLVTTQFEAVGARKALPCFDELAFKAVFQVNLGRLKNMTLISNMPIEKEGVCMTDSDAYVWDIHQETPKMSTYLLAFVISYFNFRQSKTQSNNVQFRIWSRKSVMDQTVLASEIGLKVLMFYENLFKIKFPLPKQDMIAIPDFMMGAMENWGLITYREVYLLNKGDKSSAADRELTELVISHELSHQWFGNLVTVDWWSE